jgi:hypothetical protein
VLPSPDDTCPACRRHKFDPSVPEAAVREAVASASKTERELSLWQGARAFWMLQWAVVATVLLSLADLIVFQQSEPQGPRTAIARALLAFAILGCASAGLIGAFRVVKWLRWRAPVLWAILAALPYVGVVVLIAVSRTALEEFRKQQVSMRLFGPRIPRDPSSIQ